LYFEDVNLNGNEIKGLTDPTGDKDSANKKYVDAEISKILKAETDVLKLDGTRAVTGSLDMGDHTITGIRSSSQDNRELKQRRRRRREQRQVKNEFIFYKRNSRLSRSAR